MTKIDLICTGANLRAQVHGEITAGMRGIAVEISFDEAWQGLTPVLVVECAETFRKMAVDAAGRSSIPWECCISGEKLNVGVCGLNADGTVKLPTVWASCGRVLPSADDAQAEESSAPPTPTLLEQITTLANQAQAAAHAVTEAAQRGDFNGQDGTTPNIQIGNVATVSSGTPAAVRRRGTDESLVLDFDIPKGADGQDSGLVVAPESVTAPPPEVLPLDKTLSQPDQAAEALATGIAVSGLESRLSTLESKPQIPLSVELRLKKLESAAEGNLYMFWEDDTEGCTKAVPDDVLRYATLDKIGGKTVVRNQLIDIDYADETAYIKNYCYIVLESDTLKFNAERRYGYAAVGVNTLSGHKYLVAEKVKSAEPSSNGISISISSAIMGSLTNYYIPTSTEWTLVGVIFTASNDSTGGAIQFLRDNREQESISDNTIYSSGICVYDLTQWFGADIADTITTPERAYELGVPREPIPYDAGTPVHADVERVITDVETKAIPAAIRSLPGYGWSVRNVSNTINYENKQYIKRVGQYIFNGTERWVFQTVDYPNTAYVLGLLPTIYEKNKSIICDRYHPIRSGSYKSGSNGNIWLQDTKDYPRLYVCDANVTTSKQMQSATKGMCVFYELAEPVVTDISALLPDGFENIEVEAGGTITFKQAGSLELPVPNQQTYMIKLGGGNT